MNSVTTKYSGLTTRDARNATLIDAAVPTASPWILDGRVATKLAGRAEFRMATFVSTSLVEQASRTKDLLSSWRTVDAVSPRRAVQQALDVIDDWLAAGDSRDLLLLLNQAAPEKMSEDLALALLTFARPARARLEQAYGRYFRRVGAVLRQRHGASGAELLMKGLAE